MNFQTSVRTVFSNYANFNGRARRSEYWWYFLFLVIVEVIVYVIDLAIGSGILGGLVFLATIVPTLAVAARRLHDTDRTGWWQLIGIIPLIGAIVLLVFYCTDSGPDNKHGPNPKGYGGGGFPGQQYGQPYGQQYPGQYGQPGQQYPPQPGQYGQPGQQYPPQPGQPGQYPGQQGL